MSIEQEPLAQVDEPIAARQRFGTYQQRGSTTDHRETTDGFVCATVLPARNVSAPASGILSVRVEDRVVACTSAGNTGTFDAGWNYVRTNGAASLLVPVPTGACWRVHWEDHPGSAMQPDIQVLWLPTDAAQRSTTAGAADLAPPSAMSKPWQDFTPAVNQLARVIERIVQRPLSDADRQDLAAAIAALI